MLKLKNGNIRLWGKGARLKNKRLEIMVSFWFIGDSCSSTEVLFNLKKAVQWRFQEIDIRRTYRPCFVMIISVWCL